MVNLFASLPFETIDVKSSSFLEKTGVAFAYARTSPILSLQLHWLNACLLIVASIALIILGVKAQKKVGWRLAVLLSVLLSVAPVSGAAFIAYAGNNYYSFSMATACIIAAILAVFLLFSIFSTGKGKIQTEKGSQERVGEEYLETTNS